MNLRTVIYAAMKLLAATNPAFAGMLDMSIQDLGYEIGNPFNTKVFWDELGGWARKPEIPVTLRNVVGRVIQAYHQAPQTCM